MRGALGDRDGVAPGERVGVVEGERVGVCVGEGVGDRGLVRVGVAEGGVGLGVGVQEGVGVPLGVAPTLSEGEGEGVGEGVGVAEARGITTVTEDPYVSRVVFQTHTPPCTRARVAFPRRPAVREEYWVLGVMTMVCGIALPPTVHRSQALVSPCEEIKAVLGSPSTAREGRVG